MRAKEPPAGFPPALTPFKAHLSMLDDGGKKARTPTPPQGWGKGFLARWRPVIGRTGTIPLSAMRTALGYIISRPKLDPAFSPEVSSDIIRSLVLQGTEFVAAASLLKERCPNFNT
jgi:hypothetical protein